MRGALDTVSTGGADAGGDGFVSVEATSSSFWRSTSDEASSRGISKAYKGVLIHVGRVPGSFADMIRSERANVRDAWIVAEKDALCVELLSNTLHYVAEDRQIVLVASPEWRRCLRQYHGLAR